MIKCQILKNSSKGDRNKGQSSTTMAMTASRLETKIKLETVEWSLNNIPPPLNNNITPQLNLTDTVVDFGCG